jgi:hypothetical protein
LTNIIVYGWCQLFSTFLLQPLNELVLKVS